MTRRASFSNYLRADFERLLAGVLDVVRQIMSDKFGEAEKIKLAHQTVYHQVLRAHQSPPEVRALELEAIRGMFWSIRRRYARRGEASPVRLAHQQLSS